MLKGILEGCVLKILSKKRCYSQEMVQMLKAYGFDNISEGTIFPMLLRLEKGGLFQTEKVGTNLGPSRKYYSLSNK
jgi:PadR family transcriptional regulator PadR